MYGIGEASPVRSLGNALDAVSGGRNKLIFINNGFTGGDIDNIIQELARPAEAAGVDVQVLAQEDALVDVCKNSLRGTSSCIAAAVFFSSPSEGPDGIWNYTLRADGALETKIVVDSDKNDVQVYALPLQRAVDMAIARSNTTVDQSAIPSEVLQYPYTSLSQAQRNQQIRTRYMGGIIDILAVAFFIGMCGVTYQMTGLIASEREGGMAQLLDCMMAHRARWQPQVARIVASHLAFDIIYGPAWIVMAIILKVGVFTQTSAATLILFHILAGLSLSSQSVLSGSFFHKAQLSGIISVIVSLLLAVLAQVIHKAGTGAVAILSLLFPSMNYTFFILLVARWEHKDFGANLLKAAPDNPSTLPGIAFFIFLIVQIFGLPVLGAWVERVLFGTTSKTRTTDYASDSDVAVSVSGFTKEFRPNWFLKTFGPLFRSRRQTVLAVNDLSFQALKGQIMVLLGANGSGKSTTLDAVAGLTHITNGAIHLNYDKTSGGFGLCPQKNVLWESLTVEEHVRIMNRLKSTGSVDTRTDILNLIRACDIDHKAEARSKTLSGGQRRKLQLAMMFTGGSNVCCVDEVSSGLDPISRRKIWDILLAERGSRSIILTTHFLDEADLLSDHITILSKGSLRASGTSVELKHNLGSGYRVHVYNTANTRPRQYEGVTSEIMYDQTVYKLTNSMEASRFLNELERDGIRDYQVSGPTIEDVFLKVAEEIKPDLPTAPEDETSESQANGKNEVMVTEKPSTTSPELLSGKRISMPKQALVLFRKRATVLRRNYLPYAAAFLVPVIAAGLVTLFLKKFTKLGCTIPDTVSISSVASLASQISLDLVVGPRSAISEAALLRFASTLWGGGGVDSGAANYTGLLESLHFVDTVDDFNRYINANFSTVSPGGFFAGDSSSPPIFAWRGNADISAATITQNFLDVLLTNVSISSQYQAFDIPWAPDSGKALQMIVYFGLACAVFPAFFSLYPCVERVRNVRALHYSNGVRALPLWSAYLTFDFLIVLAISVLATIIFAASSDVWFHVGYVFPVLFLYGLSSTLLSYLVSLFANSQLASFAFAAAGQAVMFLVYFIAYIVILTYAPANKLDSYVNIAHFAIATVSPIANLTRAMFVSLNAFSTDCRERSFATNPGSMVLYGGPIVYLIIQSIILFLTLLWLDGGPLFRAFRKGPHVDDNEEKLDSESLSESTTAAGVTSSQNGLRVLHLTKQFNKTLAVEDITFGVPRGEVFALLGPNGAGKSTTISLIRGDIRPSRRGGDVFVEDVSISKHRAQARSYLGVCPQFDAMDTMTVREHLDFYARIRGVPNPSHNVIEVMKAVGLELYTNLMAGQLSGGNKRKLSLGIALMGNPSVLLLDEPSSGMDAASKRVMWRTLSSVVPGRSLVLTTHSMEEADALANRAGIMAGRMLAQGTTDHLRRKHGNAYHVHLVHNKAPHTSPAEMDAIKEWATRTFPSAAVEPKTYHGQLRFSVPITTVEEKEKPPFPSSLSKGVDLVLPAPTPKDGDQDSTNTISTLFSSLEQSKADLGFEYYSVSQTTLDQVFLAIVGANQIEGEDAERRQTTTATSEGERGEGPTRARGGRWKGWLGRR